jgi:hypothetical protein
VIYVTQRTGEEGYKKPYKKPTSPRVERNEIMADVHVISGEYTIAAQATQVFTFWWPGQATPPVKSYFDVSINAELPRPNQEITPLVEVKRERGATGDARLPLYLTLQNPNNFAVKFFASHVFVSP